jgi:hypothetical protein
MSKYGTTGKTVERELFGEISLEQRREAPRYLGRHEAFKVVKSIQPGDPKDPQPDFAYEAFIRIEQLLDREGELSFYTAVGSVLDRMGVDGWFELDGEKPVTVDLTTNPEKSHKQEADIVFVVPRDGLDRSVDESQFMKYADALSQLVVRIMQQETKVAKEVY